MNETELKNTRKRLVWRSTHRGTKEVDILLGSFAGQYVPTMDEDLLVSFERFMEIADPQMHLIMTKEVELPAGLHPELRKLLNEYTYVPVPKGA